MAFNAVLRHRKYSRSSLGSQMSGQPLMFAGPRVKYKGGLICQISTYLKITQDFFKNLINNINPLSHLGKYTSAMTYSFQRWLTGQAHASRNSPHPRVTGGSSAWQEPSLSWGRVPTSKLQPVVSLRMFLSPEPR